ncbi:MAG: hypothetical protein ACK5WB_06100 [Phycisphaerales bacterium]|jgi:CheY-like chemotaxis protein
MKIQVVSASRRGVQVPIIAVTANACIEDRQRCLDAGCNDVLTNPYRKPSLLRAVAGVLDDHRPPLGRSVSAQTLARRPE